MSHLGADFFLLVIVTRKRGWWYIRGENGEDFDLERREFRRKRYKLGRGSLHVSMIFCQDRHTLVMSEPAQLFPRLSFASSQDRIVKGWRSCTP